MRKHRTRKKPDPDYVALEICHESVDVCTAVYVLVLSYSKRLRYVTLRFIHCWVYTSTTVNNTFTLRYVTLQTRFIHSYIFSKLSCFVTFRYVTLRLVLKAPTEPASLLAAWKGVLTDTSGAEEGEGRARRWEGQVRPKTRLRVSPCSPENVDWRIDRRTV